MPVVTLFFRTSLVDIAERREEAIPGHQQDPHAVPHQSDRPPGSSHPNSRRSMVDKVNHDGRKVGANARRCGGRVSEVETSMSCPTRHASKAPCTLSQSRECLHTLNRLE